MRPLARSLVVATAVVAGACATAGPSPAPSCAAAFARTDALLRDGLASYVGEIRRYAGARDPELSTDAAERRAWDRADAWTAEKRPEFLAACRGWPEEQVRCVLVADVPRVLSACGVEPFVTSFTDDVVATFAARPVEPAGAPAR